MMLIGPPSKKRKDSVNAISMVVQEWKDKQSEQLSAVHRIHGYPWRIRLTRVKDKLCTVSVMCEKMDEADLWECEALIVSKFIYVKYHKFASWDRQSQEYTGTVKEIPVGTRVEVKIESNEDGMRYWRQRPNIDPFEPRNLAHYGVLVIGEEEEEKKKIEVNKQILGEQSPFFDRLFNSEFMEKNMSEIPIKDVGYEEFTNLLRMIFGMEKASLTDDNVERVLLLADRFQIKIIEDRVVSFLLSSDCSFSLAHKLLISEQYNLEFLNERLLRSSYSIDELRDVTCSKEWNLLSRSAIRALYDKLGDKFDDLQ